MEDDLDEVASARLGDTLFAAVHLRDAPEGWAVVGHPSGAVTIDFDGNLLLGLTKVEAEDVARWWTNSSVDKVRQRYS